MHNKYSEYFGMFLCQKCNIKTKKAKFWYETKSITWRCANEHMSSVSLRKETKAERKSRLLNE